ncbi:MAG TPA: hypothetical protein PLG50_06210 [bacterium]|nr:hypothetical protein [bacterium]HQG45231.1 hypothetical protein [bacterium]HQI49564.1 hypothetical protein [bacterium]HQJ65545.1 hypothetical protein [bacterium]
MSRKTLIIDAHVHIYPNADLGLAVARSLANMDAANPETETAKIWLLTERTDCSAFSMLQSSVRIGMYHILPTRDPEALRVQLGERIVLYILAGRQVITAEGHEFGLLNTLLNLPDRELDAAACIETAREAGALLSINWAPGKWSGRRKKALIPLLTAPPEPHLFIGDSAMRPVFWSEPGLMRRAGQQGWRILAGSDPLPFKGEEYSFGRYGSMITGELDPDRPADSLRRLLLSRETALLTWGSRRGTWEFTRRQLALMRMKNKTSLPSR